MRKLLRSKSFIPVSLLSVTILLAVMPGKALGISYDTLFLHTGKTDPNTEGWTPSWEIAGEFGPLTNDAGSGFDAWFTDDNSSITLDSGAAYRQVPTASQIAQGSAFGWMLTTRMRVVDIPDTLGPFGVSNVVLYRDGTRSWQMRFGSQDDGDPIVVVDEAGGSATTFNFEGGGSGYHLYGLVFDPTAGNADLFVDGIERLSNLTGFLIAQTSVSWGNGSTFDTGQGNYNLVEFAVATPEPATLLLLGTGLAGLGFTRRRRKTI